MLSVDQINKLEAENERLNKELETAVTQYNAVVAQNKDLQKELNHYKEILVEIREDLETQVYCECSECGNDDYSECIKCMTKRYMEKINEVIPA